MFRKMRDAANRMPHEKGTCLRGAGGARIKFWKTFYLCRLISSACRTGQWFAGNLGVEDIWAEIDFPGPDDGAGEWVDGDLGEDGGVSPNFKNTHANQMRKIDYTLGSICETEVELVTGESLDSDDAFHVQS